MSWNNLSKRSKEYVDRYIRNTNKTREQALNESIIQYVIDEYENGNKNRLIFC